MLELSKTVGQVLWRFGYLAVGIRGKMKLLDFCVIGLVSVVYLSRLPSPLRSLKSDLIAKSGLTVLSAVCQLVAP
jgi:hypothetical protein